MIGVPTGYAWSMQFRWRKTSGYGVYADNVTKDFELTFMNYKRFQEKLMDLETERSDNVREQEERSSPGTP